MKPIQRVCYFDEEDRTNLNCAHGDGWIDIEDIQEDDSIFSWFESEVKSVTASLRSELEPFEVGQVVHTRVTSLPYIRSKLVLVIQEAEDLGDGTYRYTGIPISTVNKLPDGTFDRKDGSLIVEDFNQYLPGTTMQESRDVYMQYGNVVTWESNDMSNSGVLKGKLDPQLFDFVMGLKDNRRIAPDSYNNVAMSNWWVSWYKDDTLPKFKSTQPWWSKVHKETGDKVMFFATTGECRKAVYDIVKQAYGGQLPSKFRYMKEQPKDWSPFKEGFVKKEWMEWGGMVWNL